jgi:hypothetical protein
VSTTSKSSGWYKPQGVNFNKMRPRNLFPVDPKSQTNGSTARTVGGYDTTVSGFFKTTSKQMFGARPTANSGTGVNSTHTTSSPSMLPTQPSGVLFKLQTPRTAWPQIPQTQGLEYNVGQMNWNTKGVINFDKVRAREQFTETQNLSVKPKRHYFPRSGSEGPRERKTLDFERMLGRNTRIFGRIEGNPVEMGMLAETGLLPFKKGDDREHPTYQRRDYFHVIPAEDIFSENLSMIS